MRWPRSWTAVGLVRKRDRLRRDHVEIADGPALYWFVVKVTDCCAAFTASSCTRASCRQLTN